MSDQLTPAQFIAKWSRVALPERAASQEHFIDLCRMLGQPLPDDHDLGERRREVDEQVLSNLLRMNAARAGSA